MSTLSDYQELAVEKFNQFKEYATETAQAYPKTTASVTTAAVLLGLRSMYNSYRSNLKQFNLSNGLPNSMGLNNIGILITGCDTGFGRATADKLSKMGYCVIATCYTEAAVNSFNKDKSFTANGSFSLRLDVTDLESIKSCKEQVEKWLDSNVKNIFWSIVNNAGIWQPGWFEMLPHTLMMREYNVLLFGPIHVTRALLPLMYGRRGGGLSKIKANNIKNKISINNGNYDYSMGGRIVNLSSMFKYLPMPGSSRYGVCKAGISYLSNVLRAEYASTFGIWCSCIEPGPYATPIMTQAESFIWHKSIKNYYYEKNGELKNNLNESEKEVCKTFNINKFLDNDEEFKVNWINQWNTNMDEVVDDIIHSITATYPKRLYKPGHYHFISGKILSIAPQSFVDNFSFGTAKKVLKKLTYE